MPRLHRAGSGGTDLASAPPHLLSLQLCPSPDANVPFSFPEVLPTWVLALILVFTTLALLPVLRFCGIYGYR